jgi:Arc/MetJ family transcription regulator
VEGCRSAWPEADNLITEVKDRAMHESLADTVTKRCKVTRIRDHRVPIPGKVLRMARSKATITVDRELLLQVQGVVGRTNASDTIDLALRGLLKAERIRRDIAAYEAAPQTADEIALTSHVSASHADLTDDTDWEALFADDA